MCLVLFIVLVFIILLKYSDTREHFQNSYDKLSKSTNEAELDPTITFSSNTFKGTDGELVNKGKIIRAYKFGNKYRFKASEVKKSFPDAVNGERVSNNDMAIISWRAADKMYQLVVEQENNIKRLRKKLNKIEKNLNEIETKVDEHIPIEEQPTVDTNKTINDLKDFSANL